MMDYGTLVNPERERILVLGASGFSGRHFINQLHTYGMEIHAADLSDSYPEDWSGIHTYVIDLCESESLDDLLASILPHYIVNLAGILQAENFDLYYRINVDISRRILDWAVGPGREVIRKILLIGSAAEYGVPESNPILETANLNPVSFYGLSKLMQSQLAVFYARYCAVPVSIARTFNLFGKELPRSLAPGNWQWAIDMAENGDTIKVGNLEAERDYISIERAVRAYLVILLYGEVGEAYNVCSGKPVQMRSILESMVRDSGKILSIESDQSMFKPVDVPQIYGDNTKYRELSLLYEKCDRAG